jgi:Gram-negative bacterial TonB protein C-terminal
MQRTCLALLAFLMVTHAAAQTHRSAGFEGRMPWCSMVFPPQQIGGEMVYPVGNGVSAPVLVKQTKPVVPADKANLKGVALVCGIVARDGRIRTAFMDRTIGNGLDEIALDTVKQWKFRPAAKEGEPVAAPLSLQIKFGD